LAGLAEDGRIVGQVFVLVTGHHRAGPQRGDPVECVEPRLNSTPGAFQQVLVHAVVGNIAGDDQTDGRHVQHGGVVGVGVAGLDRQ
jgi:hypothetical protein